MCLEFSSRDHWKHVPIDVVLQPLMVLKHSTLYIGVKIIVLHLGCINMDLSATQTQCFQLYIYIYIMSINKSSLFVFLGLFVMFRSTK